MVENIELFGVKILICDKYASIFESFKIRDIKERIFILNEIVSRCPILKTRSYNSLLREWKVHNAFYRRKLFRKSTKDCDLEFRQNIFMKLLYFIFSKLMRE